MMISVSPIYYVTFTTAVLTASFVLFQGFNMTNTRETAQLLVGFLIIFCGVYMLNYPSKDLDSHEFESLAERFSLQQLRASGDASRQIHFDEEEGGEVLQSLIRESLDRQATEESR